MKIINKTSILFIFAMTLVTSQFMSTEAQARSSYFTSQGCVDCHAPAASTCDGCHAHGTHSSSEKSDINVTGTTSKTSYAPGETVSVTIAGGYRNGWVRAILYDQNMVELARATGPSGEGGGAGLPIALNAPAPTSAGNHTWYVAWYGNKYDLTEVGKTTTFGPNWTLDPGNPDHGQEIVSTNQFTVTATAAPSISLNPASLGFGSVTVDASATKTSQVQNLGDATLNVNAITRCAGTSTEYTWSPAAPLIIDAGGNQVLSVVYTPTDTSTDSGCLQIVSNDQAATTITLNLSGSGSAPVPQSLDIDISRLSANRRVSLTKGKSSEVAFKLSVSNPGTMSGSADANLVGVQNDVEIYNETIVVSPPTGGTAKYTFPNFLPSETGVITWMLTVADENPDVDEATATTKIVK